MLCGVRLHGQNACYVIFWNIGPKHWIYMDIEGIATHFIFIYDFIRERPFNLKLWFFPKKIF